MVRRKFSGFTFFRVYVQIIIMCIIFSCTSVLGQQKKFSVIAYYAGRPSQVDSFEVEKLTHIIFSFCHLKGDSLFIRSGRDSALILELVKLKSRNPDLKVILSLGGWGGCETCSTVFASGKTRRAFARSVAYSLSFFHCDGIDIDWEYPAIAGFPNHTFSPEDKTNFTKLIRLLRRSLGKNYEISFAAGGFRNYISESVEWKKVVPKVNRINLMTYDLVGGYATTTGHHTALYSTSSQEESADNTVKLLLSLGVPGNKLALGAAFYGRMWEVESDSLNGLYQPGKFKRGIAFNNFSSQLSNDSGFVYHWDEIAKAPFLYNQVQKLFVTYDDKKSLELKARYVKANRLEGIMFWELSNDSYTGGLLDIIDKVRNEDPVK